MSEEKKCLVLEVPGFLHHCHPTLQHSATFWYFQEKKKKKKKVSTLPLKQKKKETPLKVLRVQPVIEVKTLFPNSSIWKCVFLLFSFYVPVYVGSKYRFSESYFGGFNGAHFVEVLVVLGTGEVKRVLLGEKKDLFFFYIWLSLLLIVMAYC